MLGNQSFAMLAGVSLLSSAYSPAAAAVRIDGQVQAGGGPLANSTVTLWAASAGEPENWLKQKPAAMDILTCAARKRPARMSVLYLVAKGGEHVNKGGGDNPAIALLTVLGNTPPARSSSTR